MNFGLRNTDIQKIEQKYLDFSGSDIYWNFREYFFSVPIFAFRNTFFLPWWSCFSPKFSYHLLTLRQPKTVSPNVKNQATALCYGNFLAIKDLQWLLFSFIDTSQCFLKHIHINNSTKWPDSTAGIGKKKNLANLSKSCVQFSYIIYILFCWIYYTLLAQKV